MRVISPAGIFELACIFCHKVGDTALRGILYSGQEVLFFSDNESRCSNIYHLIEKAAALGDKTVDVRPANVGYMNETYKNQLARVRELVDTLAVDADNEALGAVLARLDALEAQPSPLAVVRAFVPPGTFKVIDNQTGAEADTRQIALKEEWPKGLTPCDMEGFAIGEDGSLYLLDECGKWAYASRERFKVIYDEAKADVVMVPRETLRRLTELADAYVVEMGHLSIATALRILDASKGDEHA